MTVFARTKSESPQSADAHGFPGGTTIRYLTTLLLLVLGLSVHANDQLPLPVQSALNLRDVPHEAASIHVVDVQSGETIVDWNSSVARNPASTIKLLTTLAALDELGPCLLYTSDAADES